MKIHPGPKGFFVRHYGAAAVFALLLAAGGVAAFSAGLDALIGVALIALGLLILAFGIAHAILNERTTWLFLSEEELVYETGITSHSVKRVPIHKITDTSTDQDVLDKLLGSCTFHINTSGSAGYEVEATGFSFSQVKQFSDQLYGLIHDTPNSLPDEKAQPKQK